MARVPQHSPGRDAAWADFQRSMRWIVVAGVLMVIGSLVYLHGEDEISVAAVLAVIGGVFLSVLLGCGLFAAAFFSDKSGHDDAVTRAASHAKDADDRDESGPDIGTG